MRGYKIEETIDFIGSVSYIETIYSVKQINKLNLSEEIINALK